MKVHKYLTGIIALASVALIAVTGLFMVAYSPAVPAAVMSGDITIDNFVLVSSRRVSRTAYEYSYRASIINAGSSTYDVTATISSADPSTVLIDNQISFENVVGGTTTDSMDVFTIRQDRRSAFNWDSLVWNVDIWEKVSSQEIGVDLSVPPQWTHSLISTPEITAYEVVSPSYSSLAVIPNGSYGYDVSDDVTESKTNTTISGHSAIRRDYAYLGQVYLVRFEVSSVSGYPDYLIELRVKDQVDQNHLETMVNQLVIH